MIVGSHRGCLSARERLSRNIGIAVGWSRLKPTRARESGRKGALVFVPFTPSGRSGPLVWPPATEGTLLFAPAGALGGYLSMWL